MSAIIIMMLITSIMMITSIILITGGDVERAGKILTENGEKKKFALRLNARARGQVFAQMALRAGGSRKKAEGERRPGALARRRRQLSPLKERLSVGRSGSSM